MLRTFMDVEASGLQDDSYPIEIAWSDSLGNSETFLITPHHSWIHWDPKAEVVHGISRERLLDVGISIGDACSRLNTNLVDETVFTDAADYDSRWLLTLFKKAEIEPLFRIEDVFNFYKALPSTQARVIQQIISANPAPHRALPDCQRYSKAYDYTEATIKVCRSLHDLGLQNVLFICTANVQRSKTCQDLFKDHLPDLKILSAGVSKKECRRQGSTLCTEELLEVADVVFTCEPMHKERINQHTANRFSNKILELDIEDRYQYMQLELLEKISEQLQKHKITNRLLQLSSPPTTMNHKREL